MNGTNYELNVRLLEIDRELNFYELSGRRLPRALIWEADAIIAELIRREDEKE